MRQLKNRGGDRNNEARCLSFAHFVGVWEHRAVLKAVALVELEFLCADAGADESFEDQHAFFAGVTDGVVGVSFVGGHGHFEHLQVLSAAPEQLVGGVAAW